MSTVALDRRLRVLENSVPIIDTLAAYALWRAHGCNPNVKWDPRFRALFPNAAAYSDTRAAALKQ